MGVSENIIHVLSIYKEIRDLALKNNKNIFLNMVP